MKKLVIAAAIAAMIGGVQAAGYDFTASVKTTKAKYGTQKTTYTVNLGKDDNGTFWWDDLGWDNEKEAKNAVKKMTNEEKAEFAILSCGFDGVKTDYNEQEAYKNKKTWCYTFKFTETVENCYRVAGSAKLTGKVTMDACCGTWEFVEYNFGKTELDNDEDGVSAINAGLIYRIGGVSLNKADKVEVTGTMGADAYDGMVPGTFAYAGHKQTRCTCSLCSHDRGRRETSRLRGRYIEKRYPTRGFRHCICSC